MKSPYALHPVSQKCPQRCHLNGSNVRLTDDGPLSSFRGRSSSFHASLHQAIDGVMRSKRQGLSVWVEVVSPLCITSPSPLPYLSNTSALPSQYLCTTSSIPLCYIPNTSSQCLSRTSAVALQYLCNVFAVLTWREQNSVFKRPECQPAIGPVSGNDTPNTLYAFSVALGFPTQI